MDFLANLPWERIAASALFATAVMAAAYLLIRLSTPAFGRLFERIKDNPPAGKPRPTSPETPDTPPAIKVMVLGLEGSGKTMMLAGMYYRWAFGGRHGVVLRADQATAEFLPRIIKVINDPDGGLPQGTREGDITKATFTFMVNIAGAGPRRSFSLHYIDYAGEHISRILFPSGSQPDPRVTKDLAEADVLVGVLDGGKIGQAMRGDPPADFANTVTGLMLHLANAEQKTIHLVISKWDLVVDQNGNPHKLSSVIEFLDTYPPFFRFHQQSPVIGVRRIIPVSTVGLNGFIRFDDDGTVRKDRTVPWQPFMAENAVACSVPDAIDTEFERAIKLYHAAEESGGRRPRGALAPLLQMVLGMLNLVATRFGWQFLDGGLTSQDLIAAYYTLKDRTVGRPAPEEDRTVESSTLRVLRLFAESVGELESEFPESQIGRYRPPRRRPRGNNPDRRPRR